jgi:ketosteroid isomerase-like protein
MKRQFILCCFSLIAAAFICFGQESPSPSPSPSATPFKTIRSATKEALIVKLEKSVTDAFKNKQAKAFREYLAPEFSAIDAEGIKDVDAEIADMQKTDLRDYSFADMKVTLANPKMAVATYKVNTQSTSSGRDTSGSYYAATVWNKRGGKWLAVLHTFVKTQ